MSNKNGTGMVFNIQGYTVHDGPGIRTEFFMKGCTMSCEWCSNPEGIKFHPEPGTYPDKCLGLDNCTACIRACKAEALLVSASNKVVGIDRTKCVHCMSCAHACPSDAIKPWGERISVEEAMKIIRRDTPFYKRTGGGVTISGGESLMQPEFVKGVFKACKAEDIHTCVETALNVPQKNLDMVLPYADMVITDIKTMDDEKHIARCGASHKQILENIKHVAASDTPLVIRTPVLKGFNATDEDMRAIGTFIIEELDNKVLQHQLLPYRVMGTEKYKSLNEPYPMEDYEGYEREEWEPDFIRFITILKGMGVNAVTGMHEKLPSVKKPYIEESKED